jgi:hypothetical protein
MDDHKSIIMMLALWALVGAITLICWLRDLRQRRLAIRWATWPLVPADKGDGPESVQHGLRDADVDLAAATDQAMSLSLRQCELAVQDLIAIGSAEEKPGQNDRPLVDLADKGDGPESVQHGLRDADMAAATDQAMSPSLRQCELAVQDLIAIGSAEERPGQNDRPLVDLADKGDGPESAQHGLRDADIDLAAVRLSSGGWRKFPSTDELKTYVDVLTGDAPRQSNARLLALVLAILVGVIGTLGILAVWLSPTPEQIQAARNGKGKRGWQQSTPAGDAQPSLMLGQYGEYEQSASTPAPEQSAAAPAPEQSVSTPAPEQPRGWIAEVKKSRPICESADDYVQIQRMAFTLRPSRAAARKAVRFVKRKCPIKMFEPGNHASVERTETFSIDKTRSITLACVVIKDGPCAWTDASALVRIPEEAPADEVIE